MILTVPGPSVETHQSWYLASSGKEIAMAGKPVFADQAEQFTMVVDALLQNEETRSAFAKEPLATLKHYGIEFADPAVAKRVETDLIAFAAGASAAMPGPDDTWPPRYYIRTFARATSITWVAKGDLDDAIRIDRTRVDAFVTQAALQSKIAVLEKKLAMLEANQARR